MLRNARLWIRVACVALLCSSLAAAPSSAQILADRPSATEVNQVLLAYLLAQKKHPTSGFELPATDVWWAWRSQYALTLDQPITDVMHLAGHNSYNSLGNGFDIVPALAPNQILSLRNQLEFGSRLVEIDIHDTDSGELEVFHAYDFPGKRDFNAVLGDVRQWLDGNPNEIVYLDIEDATERSDGSTPDTSVTLALHASFGNPATGASMLFTPAMRQALGRWPSRRELLRAGRRVVVFTHRNDAGNGRFGAPTQFVDPNGHAWDGAGLAFRADGSADPVKRGNFVQHKVQDLFWSLFFDPSQLANPNYFLSMQSDGIDPLPPVLLPVFTDILLIATQVLDQLTALDADRALPAEIRTAALLNVNFLKMDFLFGHDEDAGLGANVAHFYGVPYNRDDAYEIENDGSRVNDLAHAIWSWLPGDPAVQRQIFQDLFAGDGSGALQAAQLTARMNAIGHPEFIADLDAKGTAARANGRDFAVQGTGLGPTNDRWVSATAGGTIDLSQPPRTWRFALRSTVPDPQNGVYRWKLSTTRGTVSDAALLTPAELQDADGYHYVFAAPVNGLQNHLLVTARQELGESDPVWINVNDTDRDGRWVACPCAPEIDRITIRPAPVVEGGTVTLSVQFSDEDAVDRHTATINWGDGSPLQQVPVTAGSRTLDVTHRYLDDNPSGSPADWYTVAVALRDGAGAVASGSASILVANAVPAVTSVTSTAPASAPGREGEPLSASAVFSDAGTLDSHTGMVAWGDGTVQAAAVTGAGGAGTAAADHAYAVGGVYDIGVRIDDDDTGWHSGATRAFVTGAGLHNGTLQVVGTPGRDVITIHRQDGKYVVVHARFLGNDQFRTYDVSLVRRIEIYVCGAEDQINVAPTLDGIDVAVIRCQTSSLAH
jgi:hypothetical protein